MKSTDLKYFLHPNFIAPHFLSFARFHNTLIVSYKTLPITNLVPINSALFNLSLEKTALDS